MAEKREILLDIQVRAKDAQKQLAEVQKRLTQNSESQKELNRQLKAGEISLDAYAEATTAVKLDSAELRKEQRSLTRQIQNSTKATDAAEGSNEQLRAQLSLLTAEYNSLSKEQRENTERGKELEIQTRQISDALKENESAIGDNRRNVGNYQSALDGLGGALDNIIPGFGGISTAVKSIASAGPAALFAGIAAAVGTAAKAVIDITKEFGALRDQVNQITGETGDDLSDLTGQIKGIADTFGVDFNEVLQATNATAQQFGVTTDEALAQISEGFINGANASGQYLDQLREYPTQLASVGLSFEEANALILQQTQEGIFSDKGIDAIKEAGIRLRELTPATRDALEGIGLSAEEIETQLRDGTVSLFDVIGQVSGRLNELPEQSTEVGTAIADIFGGPGEDAGIRYLKRLGEIEGGIEDVSLASAELTARQRATLESTQNLSRAKAELADRFDDIVNAGGTLVDDALAFVIDAFIAVIDALQPVIDGAKQIFEVFKSGTETTEETGEEIDILGTIINALVLPLKVAANALGFFYEQIATFIKFVVDGISESKLFQGAISALSPVFSFLGDVINNTSAAISGVGAVFSTFVDNIKARAQLLVTELELLAKRIEGFFSSSDAVEQQIKALEAQKENLQNAGKDLGEAYSEAFNAAIAQESDDTVNILTEAQRKKLEEEAEAEAERKKKLAQQLAEEERQRQLQLSKEASQRRQEQAAKEIAERKAMIENLIAEEKLGLVRLERDTLIAEDRKNELRLEREKRLIELRAQLNQADLEQQSAEYKLIEEESLAEIEQLYRDAGEKRVEFAGETTFPIINDFEEITAAAQANADAQFEAFAEAERRKREESEKTKQFVELTEEDKLQIIANAAGTVAQIAGEESTVAKAAAIAQATINTYLAASKALATVPPPFGQILAGVAIAQGLAQVANIAGVQTSFQDGGLIEGPRHAQGGVPFAVGGAVGFEAEGGEFILNRGATRMFLPQIVAMNEMGKRANFETGGFVAGAQAATLDVSSRFQQATQTGSDIMNAIANLPSPVVTVRDINTVQDRVKVKENLGNL